MIGQIRPQSYLLFTYCLLAFVLYTYIIAKHSFAFNKKRLRKSGGSTH